MPEPYIPDFPDYRAAAAHRPRKLALGALILSVLDVIALVALVLSGFFVIGLCLAMGWFAGCAVFAALAGGTVDFN